VALVRERTIPTKRPPLVGDVSTLRIEGVAWSARLLLRSPERQLDDVSDKSGTIFYGKLSFQSNDSKWAVSPKMMIVILRILHCVDNWLTDGGKVVSPMHWPRFTLEKHYFSASGTHFC
jgi:hypothetical protein